MSYIYILTNESLPGVVKVGMTTKNPSERAAELHTTGVPTPFLVFAAWKIPADALKECERKAHKTLARYRVRTNREFFKIDAASAKEKLAALIPTQENIEAQRKRDKLEKLRNLQKRCDPIEKDISNLSRNRNSKIGSINRYQASLSEAEPIGRKYVHAFYGAIAMIGEWSIILIGISSGVYFFYINKKHNIFLYAGSAFIVYWITSSANKIITPWVERLEMHRWGLPDPHSVLRERIRMAEDEIKLIDRELHYKSAELVEIQRKMTVINNQC